MEEADFQTRWEAALALRKEKERKAQSGVNHLKHKRSSAQKHQQKSQSLQGSKSSSGKESEMSTDASTLPSPARKVPPQLVESQENPTIDPRQSLFDNHMSETLEDNVKYMSLKFGFFIPDRESLVDLEGLLGYCQEKIKLGHYCLYCEKVFPTWQGCQNHMISKRHTKLRYEQGYWDDLDPFYDFKAENEEYDQEAGAQAKNDKDTTDVEMAAAVTEDDGDDDGWEDMSEDEEKKGDGDDEDDVYQGYEKEIARFGLDVTPLGELVFPDGRIIGHRALRRYYKQNLRPVSQSTAIVAAKRAAGERIYDGQVVNISGNPMPRDQLKGSGKGILVPLKGGVEGFSVLSLYRYRAAVRKQRRDDEKGQRLHFRTKLNMNRMDKKANRLMNGVSVAHAAR